MQDICFQPFAIKPPKLVADFEKCIRKCIQFQPEECQQKSKKHSAELPTEQQPTMTDLAPALHKKRSRDRDHASAKELEDLPPKARQAVQMPTLQERLSTFPEHSQLAGGTDIAERPSELHRLNENFQPDRNPEQFHNSRNASQQLFAEFDRNNDGVIDRSEISAAHKEVHTRKEVFVGNEHTQVRQKQLNEKHAAMLPSRMMAAFDQNKDGVIDRAEFGAAYRELPSTRNSTAAAITHMNHGQAHAINTLHPHPQIAVPRDLRTQHVQKQSQMRHDSVQPKARVALQTKLHSTKSRLGAFMRTRRVIVAPAAPTHKLPVTHRVAAGCSTASGFPDPNRVVCPPDPNRVVCQPDCSSLPMTPTGAQSRLQGHNAAAPRQNRMSEHNPAGATGAQSIVSPHVAGIDSVRQWLHSCSQLMSRFLMETHIFQAHR